MHFPNVYTNGTSVDIGKGQQNTSLLISNMGSGSNPAAICDKAILNGYSDWFLPSRDELQAIYNNMYFYGIGGNFQSLYWSSSDNCDVISIDPYVPGAVWCFRMDVGTTFTGIKYGGEFIDEYAVRAIRKVKLKQ